MKKKEISSFSYGILAVLGAGGLLFSLFSPNGSGGGAAVGAFFATLGLAGIVRNGRLKKRGGAPTDNGHESVTEKTDETHS